MALIENGGGTDDGSTDDGGSDGGDTSGGLTERTVSLSALTNNTEKVNYAIVFEGTLTGTARLENPDYVGEDGVAGSLRASGLDDRATGTGGFYVKNYSSVTAINVSVVGGADLGEVKQGESKYFHAYFTGAPVYADDLEARALSALADSGGGSDGGGSDDGGDSGGSDGGDSDDGTEDPTQPPSGGGTGDFPIPSIGPLNGPEVAMAGAAALVLILLLV